MSVTGGVARKTSEARRVFAHQQGGRHRLFAEVEEELLESHRLIVDTNDEVA